MNELVYRFIELKDNLYPTDFLDIFITALFIYSLFILIRRSRNYMVFLGLTFAFFLYIIAKNLNLYLTLTALRYFAGISVLIIVIIFQSEIRKYLELLGLIGTRQIKVGRLSAKSPTIIEIIHACIKMAQSKTGALIVIEGRDNLDRFIEGGLVLDGAISEEIILSIFDHHSEGHDGAVIINNERISKFGAYLPLSTNFKEIGKHGTRHSAGLGLAEDTDAMCIVVSEEKGKISIGRDGKLKPLTNLADLEKEVEKFIKTKYSAEHESWIDHMFRHNFWLKAGSILLASFVWFIAVYQAGIVEKKFSVPITFDNLPQDTIIQSFNPTDVVLTVKSRGDAAFSNVLLEHFNATVDATNLQKGFNKVGISDRNISIPRGLVLVAYEPETILLSVEKYFNAQVPIVVRTKGLPKDMEIENMTVTPDQIEVLVPFEVTPPIDISTEEIDLENQPESIVIPVILNLPEDIKLSDENQIVSVAFTLKKKN